MIRDNLRVLRFAALSSLADLRTIYTWRSWSFAWLSRILCQVAFFALIGRLLDGPGQVEYLLVGNSVYVVTFVAMLVCASTAWERQAGTLPMLVAAPMPAFTIFVGRSVHWLADGVVCATVALFAMSPLLGVPLPMPAALAVVPIIALVGVTTYCFGLVLAGLALRRMELRNLVGNVGSLSLMMICGVQVPSAFWPAPVHALAAGLPLTHGLLAIRALLAGGPTGTVLGQVALEAAVGAGWLLIAGLTFRRFAESGRRTGAIEFGE